MIYLLCHFIRIRHKQKLFVAQTVYVVAKYTIFKFLISNMADMTNKSKIFKIDDFRAGFLPLDQFEFHHRLAETDGIALVLFYKQSCSSCEFWHTLLLKYQSEHKPIKLFSVDVERDSGLANEYEIFHLPVIHLYKNGHFHCDIQCEAAMDTLETCIEKALSNPAQDLP